MYFLWRDMHRTCTICISYGEDLYNMYVFLIGRRAKDLDMYFLWSRRGPMQYVFLMERHAQDLYNMYFL